MVVLAMEHPQTLPKPDCAATQFALVESTPALRLESMAAQVKVVSPYGTDRLAFEGDPPFEHNVQTLVIPMEHPQTLPKPDCAAIQLALVESTPALRLESMAAQVRLVSPYGTVSLPLAGVFPLAQRVQSAPLATSIMLRNKNERRM